MRFEWVDTRAAVGAVLAHTHKVGRRTLKKGRALEETDVEALLDAELDHVMVALLEEGDVDEDAAASRLAAKIAGEGVRIGSASTGRSNLYAERRGLVTIDRAAVDRINGIDESMTLATLPEFSLVGEGTMIATVKVIPFAVAETVVSQCEEVARAHASTLRIAALQQRRAGILLTELPGTHPKVMERASRSLRTRVERLGSTVGSEIRCAHDPRAVEAAVAELRAAGCDPILMLGASAIADRRDVLPAAVVAGGGRLLHLGMPVDPGNLLLLAEQADTTIIGVPGCARSLKPSGFDWVLERVLADLRIEGSDLMGMGVGGLLKEGPSRPMPRESQQASVGEGRAHVAVVVLAAGQSRRMGEDNKLLCEIEGQPMIARVVDAAMASAADSVTVVTGHDEEAVREALRGRAVAFAHNPDYAAGMSTSLRVGIQALENKAEGALLCLGDMPWVGPEHLDALISAFDPEDDRGIYVPVYDRKRGNPVLWHRRHFAQMAELHGDQGARALLEEHADEICYVPVSSRAINIDVDTPEALRNLTRPD